MQGGERLRLEQIQEFLKASQDCQFEGRERPQIYEWVTSLLRQHSYGQQGRAAKSLLRCYLIKMTGMSRAQMTRLIAQYGEKGKSRSPLTGGIALPLSTREAMWLCWPAWMKRTKH